MALELLYPDATINININNNYNNECNDELNFGIDMSNQSVTYVNQEIVNDDEIANPFIIGLNGGNLKNYPQNVIWTYPHVVVLTLKNDRLTQEEYGHFFSSKFSVNNTEMKYIKIDRVATSILNNKYFYTRANIITDKILNYFIRNEFFNTSEIVITMIDTPTQILNNILTPINSLERLLQTLKTYKYYNKFFDGNIDYQINNIPTINYWFNRKHCNINITELFTLRDFQSKKDTKFILISKPQNPEAVTDNTGDTQLYPQRIKNKDNFCDIGVCIKKNKKGFFPTIKNNTDYKKLVTEIFLLINNSHSERYEYLLANYLLISKDYTDSVINNSQVLDIIQPLFEKYIGAFKYSIGYAWLNLYLEETLYTTKSLKKHRHVFDIHTANKLPVFPFSMENIKQNPYVSLLIDDQLINYNGNCLPINIIENYDGYGITDLKTFKERLNIFITNDITKDIFNGIDWSKFALSGSIIPACLQKRSPLMDVCTSFNDFISKYYSNSDIDIMCNCKSFFDFLDEGVNVFNTIKQNTDSDDTNVKIETIKSVAISVTKQFFTDTVQDFNSKYNLTWTVDEYLGNINDERIREYLYNLYVNYKTKLINELKQTNSIGNKLREEYAQLIPIDKLNLYFVDYELDAIKYLRETESVMYRNDFLPADKTVDVKKNNRIIKFSENFRFKFTFDKINRQIEYFKIATDDFFELIARFHLPCVRAYYQGDNVYMLPSCITSMMTGINIEYKYFAGIRNPVEIINKYMIRGFGMILNPEELRQFKQFNTNLSEDNLFKLKDNDDNSLLGLRPLSHKTFNQYPANKWPKINYLTNEKIEKYYNNKNKMIDALKFTTINTNGDINPCIKSYFELYYNTNII
jgi:hypothetical protein